MSTKTKKLSAGVPIVGSDGAVTPVTIAELARQVGKELGVQQAAYRVGGVKWIRIARVDSNGGIVILKNFYANALSKGVVIAFTGAHNHLNCDAKILSGSPTIFDCLRFVANSGIVYLEIHSSSTGENPWAIKLYSIAETQVNGSKMSGCELYQSLTEGEITQGYAAKELTLTDLQWGGVKLSFTMFCIAPSSPVRHFAMKGGRHEQDEKDTRIADGNRGRVSFGSNCRRIYRKTIAKELFQIHGFLQFDKSGSERVDRDRILWNPCRSLHELSGYKRRSVDRFPSVGIRPLSGLIYSADCDIWNLDAGNVYSPNDKGRVGQLGAVYDTCHIADRKEAVAA